MKLKMNKIVQLVVLGAVCISMTGCSVGSGKGSTGLLNSNENNSSDGSAKEELSYNGSVVNEGTLEKVSRLEEIIDGYYYFETSDEDLENGIYAGLVQALDDPYAKYYTPEEYAKLQEDSSGEYAGIGVVVRQDEETGYPVVVSITDDSPAKGLDIEPEDLITKIDGYEIQSDDDLDYLVTLIRGEEGTNVTIEIYRRKEHDYHEVTITRKIIENQTVSYYMIGDKIGYVSVAQFISNTSTMFRDAVNDLETQGMEGMIIDLRDNPGGMLNVVVDMCDFLLPAGKIVYQEDKNGTVLGSYESTDDEQYQKPIVILVNGNSASASEVMTGALKDYDMATIVGQNTFGKGIVQSLIPLSDGSAIKLTTAKYFTPNGNDIHEKGIAPDVEVQLPEDYTTDDYRGTKDTQYQKAIEIMSGLLGIESEETASSEDATEAETETETEAETETE